MRSLRAIAIVGIGILSLGCGPDGARQANDNEVRLALINDPIMNPVLAPDIGSILINKVLFPGLVRPGIAGGVEPDLATNYSIADDGLAYTFHLRPNILWHDSVPFRAADVVFTFERINDRNSGSLLWSDFSIVRSVTAIDSLTVRFTLSAPFAPFLTLLGHNAGIIPAHAFAGPLAEAVTFSRRRPIGTGPFMVSETVAGSHVVLVRNPNYYGPRPSLDRMIFKIVPDVATQVAQLRAGELDLATLEPANLRGGALDRDSTLFISRVSVPQHYYIGLNHQLPLFQPAGVRRALVLAINRQAIIDGVLLGYGEYPYGTIPMALRDYYASDAPAIKYDTTAALAELKASGWSRDATGTLVDATGKPFTFTLLVDKGNPSREQTAVAVQQDLRKIGITMEIETLEFAAMVRDYIQPHRYQAHLIWWNTPLDPDQFSYYGTLQANNDIRYANREVDSVLQTGRATLDPAIRRAAYRRYQEIEAIDPPVIVLYYPQEIQVRRRQLSGVPPLGIRDALRHSEQFVMGNR